MASRTQWRRRRATVLGGVVLIFFVGLVTLSLVSQHGLPFAPRSTVRAAFDSIGDLRQGDDVRIANVRVGYVSSIDLVNATDPKNGEAKEPVVTMKLDDSRPVYNNAQAISATVGSRSALGQKFVDLNPGDPSRGLLPAGQVISVVHSVGAQDISDLLNVLDMPTRQAIGSTVRNVGGGLAGHSDDLHAAFNAAPDILPDLGHVSMALDSNNGRDFAALLHSANELSASFRGRQQHIGQLLGKLDKTFAGLNADGGKALAATLQTAPDSLRQTKTALDSLNKPLQDTSTATRSLLPGGQALGQATPDVRGVFVESKPPLEQVPGVSDDAQPAFDDLHGTFNKLQPLTPMLENTFSRGGALGQVLSPYAPQASTFFTNVTKALQQGNDNFHWLNVAAIVNGTENLTDLVGGPVRDPMQTRDADPAPGQTPKQVRGFGVPSLPNLGGANK